jgi:antirestriction protein ArdC
MSKERFDIHQHITDKIVSAIERGAGDFRLPWNRSAGSIMRPVNVASKKPYRGVNVTAHSIRIGDRTGNEVASPAASKLESAASRCLVHRKSRNSSSEVYNGADFSAGATNASGEPDQAAAGTLVNTPTSC